MLPHVILFQLLITTQPGTPALSVPQPEEAMNVLTTRAQQLSGVSF
jgi:hypothetical protein